MNKRPEQNEYAPYYSDYISLIPEGDIEQILKLQIIETTKLLANLSDQRGLFRYETDKWSIKEVIGHIVDTERIMGYRLLTIARGDSVAMPGYDENAYILQADFNQQPMEELLETLSAVRQSTLYLLKGLKEEDWVRWGNANGFEVTVRAIAFIIAGHEIHHRKILAERYFGSKDFPSA
ncbi:DinB family protein [Metabacillus idriensis]|uniref:DinB family protein n=1 Tax=Metabacillus idriensis TaxID=324768 RepID=UPI00174A73EB|nr:DinB family protein [Metabacillus idriensis]